MPTGPRLVAIAIVGAMVFAGVRCSLAQEEAPDLDMLLNLDLFTPSPSAANGRPLFDQLRTLNDLGLIRRHEEQDLPAQALPPANTLQIPSVTPPPSNQLDQDSAQPREQPPQDWSGPQDQPPPGPPLEDAP